MASFFSYFPSLLYSNTAVTNIIAKVRFEESVIRNLAVFYPYTIENGERPDQIANFYYGSSKYDWLVYLCNNITDPYHDWPKSEEVFSQYIIEKYSTIANAQLQTAFYKNNYEIDETVISIAAYEALSAGQKKYWSPILNFNNSVISYERKSFDIASDTNKIITLDGNFSNSQLEVGDLVRQTANTLGTVSFVNDTSVSLKHISGTWTSNTTMYLKLSNTVVNASVTSVTTIFEAIPTDEFVYWTAISFYDHERELNDSKKHIRLINPSYVGLIEKDMKELLIT